MTTHTSTDFHLELAVMAAPERLRSATADVERWWSTALERSGDEFTVHFDENWTRMRVDGGHWTVTAQDTPALPVPDEWVGDELTFAVEEAADGTSILRFTHHGLQAQECASLCRPAWQHYIASLVALAETGEGRPWRPGLGTGGGTQWG